MAHVVTSPCIGTHDTACMKVCPSDAYYDVELSELGLKPKPDKPNLTRMLIINPEECIDCGQCIPECPVSAVFAADEVPEADKKFVAINADWFKGKDRATLDKYQIKP